MPFPKAQLACLTHCPFQCRTSSTENVNTSFGVIGLTRTLFLNVQNLHFAATKFRQKFYTNSNIIEQISYTTTKKGRIRVGRGRVFSVRIRRPPSDYGPNPTTKSPISARNNAMKTQCSLVTSLLCHYCKLKKNSSNECLLQNTDSDKKYSKNIFIKR